LHAARRFGIIFHGFGSPLALWKRSHRAEILEFSDPSVHLPSLADILRESNVRNDLHAFNEKANLETATRLDRVIE
jgi:hypothetical protein